MLIEEESEVRPPLMPAVVMPIPESNRPERHDTGACTLWNRMWRGMDRRQNVRLARLWPQERRE